MRFAIASDGEAVSAHFGRCPGYTVVDIKDGQEVSREFVENPGHHPGVIPEFLNKLNVKCIVSGGMGQRAVALFRELGIDIVTGAQGKIEDIIGQIIDKSLQSKESLCKPGDGKGYGLDKSVCDHE